MSVVKDNQSLTNAFPQMFYAAFVNLDICTTVGVEGDGDLVEQNTHAIVSNWPSAVGTQSRTLQPPKIPNFRAIPRI
jgi:hypothetical protein